MYVCGNDNKITPYLQKGENFGRSGQKASHPQSEPIFFMCSDYIPSEENVAAKS